MNNKQPTIEQLAEAKDILDHAPCKSTTAYDHTWSGDYNNEEQDLIKAHITKCNEAIKNLRIGIKELTKTLDKTIAMKRQFKKEIKNI